MPAGATYEPIATNTLSSANTITFSSISASYTDLRIILMGTNSSANDVAIRLNSDSGSNYSYTRLGGNGSTASSSRVSNSTYAYGGTAMGSTIPSLHIIDFFSYAGSTNKTILAQTSRDQNGSGEVERLVNLWRSTSAITSISLSSGLADFSSGTTATLYGIKAA